MIWSTGPQRVRSEPDRGWSFIVERLVSRPGLPRRGTAHDLDERHIGAVSRNLLEFIETADAEQYHASKSMRAAERATDEQLAADPINQGQVGAIRACDGPARTCDRRADQQHAWVMAGDPRGTYGTNSCTDEERPALR